MAACDNELRVLSQRFDSAQGSQEDNSPERPSPLDGMLTPEVKGQVAALRPFALKCPKEDLPLVGELHRLKGQRYLTIARWEELPEGKAESMRLSAKLCCAKEVAIENGGRENNH